MTVSPSVRVEGLWCSEAREARPVRSSGRREAASEVEGAAVYPEAAVGATEVSVGHFYPDHPEGV